MNIINFEDLGLSFKVNRIAIDLWGIKIYWYGIFIVIGFVLALILCKKDDGKYNIKFDDILLLTIIALPIILICARLYYVIFNFSTYIIKPTEILNLRNGGLAIYGGIIGAIGTIAVYCKLKKINLLDTLDYLAPFLSLGQAIGRWGNFFNIEAHGTETSSILRMGIVENGHYIQVHPTFLYESVCTFIIFIILYKGRNKRKYSGQIMLAYFFMYGIVRSIIEGLRTDSLMLGSFRVSQVLSIVLSITCGSILLYKRFKK